MIRFPIPPVYVGVCSFHSRRGRSRPRRPHTAAGAQFLALAAVAVLIVGCGGGGGDSTSTSGSEGGSESAGGNKVTIADYTYEPADLTVSKGTTVVFTNEDSTAHTATSKDSGVFESGSIEPGKSGKVTLDKAGTFAYFCAFHPFMKGTIEVE